MYYLKTESSFDSAHFLKGYNGKCRNLHGHRWRVVVEIAADQLKDEGQTRGMLVDFSDLKNALEDICDDFDHSLIYEKDSRWNLWWYARNCKIGRPYHSYFSGSCGGYF